MYSARPHGRLSQWTRHAIFAPSWKPRQGCRVLWPWRTYPMSSLCCTSPMSRFQPWCRGCLFWKSHAPRPIASGATGATAAFSSHGFTQIGLWQVWWSWEGGPWTGKQGRAASHGMTLPRLWMGTCKSPASTRNTWRPFWTGTMLWYLEQTSSQYGPPICAPAGFGKTRHGPSLATRVSSTISRGLRGPYGHGISKKPMATRSCRLVHGVACRQAIVATSVTCRWVTNVRRSFKYAASARRLKGFVQGLQLFVVISAMMMCPPVQVVEPPAARGARPSGHRRGGCMGPTCHYMATASWPVG